MITTPYTFASTAEVIRYFGARPRFVDIRRDTFNIDSEQAVAAINSRTKAIIPVHIGGHPADLEPLDKAAQEHGLALIEDAAHAPASYQGINRYTAGSFGCLAPSHLLQLLRHQDPHYR